MGVYFMGIIYLVLITEFIHAAGYDNITSAAAATTTSATISSSASSADVTIASPSSLTPASAAVSTLLALSTNVRPTELFNSQQLNSSPLITTTTASVVAATANASAIIKSNATTLVNSSSNSIANNSNNAPPHARRLVPHATIGRTNRDNKLMSVLQARRSALTRGRWRPHQKESESPSSVEITNECTEKCKDVESNDCVKNCIITHHKNRLHNTFYNVDTEDSTSESNLILSNGEEFLETDETVHGLYVVDPRTRYSAGNPLHTQTKESNNFISNINKTSDNKSKEAKNDISTKSTTAKSIRMYYDIRAKRTENLRSRAKPVPAAEKSVEETDLTTFSLFGLKLPASRNSESRNHLQNSKRSPTVAKEIKKSPVPAAAASSSASTSSSAEDNLEIMEVSSVPRSTEKNKFWNNRSHLPSRNIVAYLRRSNNFTKPELFVAATPETLARYSTLHPDGRQQRYRDDIRTVNLSEANSDRRLIYSRSANISNIRVTTEKSEATTTVRTPTPTTIRTSTASTPSSKSVDITNLFQRSGVPRLLINIPEDATPEIDPVPPMVETIYESETTTEPTEREQQEEEEEILVHRINEEIPTIESRFADLIPELRQPQTTSPTTEDIENSRTFVSLPDINHIFQNISTPTPATTSTEATTVAVTSPPSKTTTPAPTTTASTTTTTTTASSTSTPMTSSIKTTLVPSYVPTVEQTTAPSISSTTFNTPAIVEETTAPAIEQSTISTTLNSNSTVISTTTTTAAPMNAAPEGVGEETSRQLTVENTTTLHAILSELYNPARGISQKIPAIMNFSVILSASNNTPTKKPTVVFDGVILHHNSDVVIEMHKMNTATFVLAGLGMLPIIIIILYVIKTVLLKKDNKVSSDLERYIPDGQPISPVVRLESDTSSATDESLMTECDFNRNNLRFKSLLGEGNFGQVWKAEADDLAGHLGTTRIVAVKTERVDNGQGDLKAEAEIMKKLGSHSNVVTLLGACTEKEPYLLIMEFAMRGRLLSLLRAARSAVNGLAPSSRPPVMPLSPRRLTGFAHDIARGMEYIADKKIVHRDLAARNVLLDHNGVCKICDFGMSVDLEKSKTSQMQIRIPRVQHSESRFRFDLTARAFGGIRSCDSRSGNNSDTKSRPALPIRWMAPEALQYHIFSTETDVWAFGIVLWELATLGCTPYPNLSGREVVRSIPSGVRPEIPPDCRRELYELMTQTWRKDPRQRPTFSESRLSLARSLCQWQCDDNDNTNDSEYLDVSGFSEDLEQGMVYFNRRVSEFECEI